MLILPDYENWKADCQEQARILAFYRKIPGRLFEWYAGRGDYKKKIKAVKRNLLYRRKLRKTKAEYSPRDETVRIEILAYNENWLPVVSGKFLLQKILQRHRHF